MKSRAAALHCPHPLALALAGALATACSPVEEPPPPVAPFRAPAPAPRRNPNPHPELALWVTAWQGVQAQAAALQTEMQRLQQIHVENHFDSFLTLDPETLDLERLCSLFHFLERGYFTIEREILVRLLERRVQRAESPVGLPPAGRASLKDRISAAMQREELRLVDLETALEVYRLPGEEPFIIPESLTEEETAELRAAVSSLLAQARSRIAALDTRIAELRARAGLPAAPP